RNETNSDTKAETTPRPGAIPGAIPGATPGATSGTQNLCRTSENIPYPSDTASSASERGASTRSQAEFEHELDYVQFLIGEFGDWGGSIPIQKILAISQEPGAYGGDIDARTIAAMVRAGLLQRSGDKIRIARSEPLPPPRRPGGLPPRLAETHGWPPCLTNPN